MSDLDTAHAESALAHARAERWGLALARADCIRSITVMLRVRRQVNCMRKLAEQARKAG